jgi:hypothetical protein
MAHHSSTKSHGYEEFCMIQGRPRCRYDCDVLSRPAAAAVLPVMFHA